MYQYNRMLSCKSGHIDKPLMIKFILIQLISFYTLFGTVNGAQSFDTEPIDVEAKIGSRVTLPCRVLNKVGNLQWTKDDFGLGTDRNLSSFVRYQMIGTDADGDYTLEIKNLSLEDDGRYQCQVSPGPEGDPGIRSNFAQLTVLVPPDPPRIHQGEFYLANANEEIQLECEAIGGKPAAKLTWIDDAGDPIQEDDIKQIEEPLPDGRITSKAILNLTPEQKHHNTTFSCHAEHQAATDGLKSAEIKIEVRYAPEVVVSIISGAENDDVFPVGSEAHFKCEANGNPTEIKYKWFINDDPIIGDYTTEMMINSVTRSLHKAEVKCVATNEVGTGENTLQLNVKYPPVFIITPKSVEADEDERITLECEVDGNPVEIIWVHDPIDRINFHPKVLGSSTTLRITVSEETAGRYFCKANVAGYPEIKSEATVYLKEKPKIISSQQQFGLESDTVQLECVAISVPKARHISWSYNGREINTNSGDEFTILEDPIPQGIKSTLIIRETQYKHFGQYNCTVANDYGTDVQTIDLIHKNNFQMIMYIVGGITVALVLFVGVIIIIICWKLRVRRDVDVEKNGKQYDEDFLTDKQIMKSKCCGGVVNSDNYCDQTSNSSDVKPDIRPGSSESDYSLASTAKVIDNTMDIKGRRGSSPLDGNTDLPPKYRYVDYVDSAHYAKPNYGSDNYGYKAHLDDRYYLPPSLRSQHYVAKPITTNNYNHPRQQSGSQSLIYGDNSTYDLNRLFSSGDYYIGQDNGLPTSNRSSYIV